jgi:pimeloyl-ACP methyl ester carboxylesterase
MRLSSLAMLAALAATPCFAEEQVLSLDQGIAATLNLPGGEGPFPAVLMLHGFGSSRDEVGNMYADAAAALADAGIASLRIDFRGFGKSDGDTGDHTVDRQNEDALIGLTALLTTEGVDPARVGVLGFSFGGGAAIELAAAHPDDVTSVVVWSSVGNYDVDFLESLGQATFDRAAAEGIVGLDLGWRTMALKAGFFDSLATHDILGALATYEGPFLTITGADDYYVQYSAPMAEAAAGEDVEALVIEGADHIYHVFDPAASSAGQVIETTVARFAGTL